MLLVPALLMVAACGQKESSAPAAPASKFTAADGSIQSRLDKYATVRLTTDLSKVSEQDRAVLGHFINAAEKIHDIFWQQAYGEPGPLLGGITDPALRRLVEINVGPWDRIDANAPFVAGVGPKPAGAQFYPVDMTKEEFEAFSDPAKTGLYSLVRRDEAGKLKLVPYSQAYATQLKPIAAELRSAAAITTDSQLKKYLELRATALETDDYRPSDFAWMEMKRNTVDLVIGPIENYEDQLFGYRTAFEAYVLVKDMQWSERLARFAKLLPELQRGLPVPAAYKKEPAGSASDLNAYDVVYVAGDANASTKTIAINLPNDEEVGLKAGTRRLQLKNAIQAKFEATLLPIAGELIAKDQLQHVNPDAFFANVMFHEVAHGLGIKNTLDGKGDGARRAEGNLQRHRGVQGRHPGAVSGDETAGKEGAQGHHAGRSLRDLRCRHRPLGALGRLQRAFGRQHDRVQLLRGPRRVHARRGDRHLPRQRGADVEGRHLAGREAHPAAG